MSSSRAKRLLRELAEVTACPLPAIVCAPLGDTLDEWHGNVRGAAGGDWEELVVHFVVTFPASYPAAPPRVRLATFIPHMNVVANAHQQWEVCLDMLETQPTNTATLPYRYWSSAFSVRSLLVQLSSFLLTEDQPTETSRGSMAHAMQEAREFVCRQAGCSHCWGQVSPAFPSMSVVESAPMCFPSVQVSGDEAQQIQTRIFQRRLAQQQRLIEEAQVLAAASVIQTTDTESENTGSAGLAGEDDKQPVQQPEPMMVVPKPVWQTVKGRGKRVFTPPEHEKASSSSSRNSSAVEDIGVDNMYELLARFSTACGKLLCSQCFKKYLAVSGYSKSQLAKGDSRKCNACLSTNASSLRFSTPNSSSFTSSCASTTKKHVDKNFERRERKRMRAKQPEPQGLSPSSLVVTETSNSSVSHVDDIRLQARVVLALGEEQMDVVKVEQMEQMEKVKEEEVEWKRGWRAAGAVCVATDSNMGCFSLLPRDTALCVLAFLEVNAVLALGTACRGTSDMIDDWVLWKLLLGRHYPRSALDPRDTDSASWKHAYMLEANHLSSELRCFHSFATKADGEILTMPLEYTINPKTRELDYATSTFDVLSLSAYNDEHVRHSVWGEKFSTVIPYYIDDMHFEKALKVLHKVARNLIGPSAVTPREMEEWKAFEADTEAAGGAQCKFSHSRGRVQKYVKPVKAWAPCNEPEMIMTLIVRMMNTQVVLLSDKGIEASEVALTGYCQLHRLLLAVVDKYPQLRSLIRKRLDMFVRRPESRVKSKTPSLGELMVYLSVSDSYSWPQLAMAFLLESFDRSVLWSCSKDSSLAQVKAGDADRLDKYLLCQKVAMRLTLFHCVFLRLLVKNGGSQTKLDDCKDRYDTFQGRPPRHMRSDFHRAVQSILAFDTWPQFFHIAGVPLPSKQHLLFVLEKAVGNSMRKGYHSHSTDFSRLMSNGVSKILLKGESYSAAPNLKKIQLLEKWKYDGPVIFLDASCLVFSFHGALLGQPVDYANTQWGNGCIRHSGDVVFDGQGQHTIDIDIHLIPANVKALFFTVSAWTTTLRAIAQPSCHLHDVHSDTEMCRYKHEGADTGDKTAVIMCKLHRFSPTSRWELTSIGSVGYGRAGNYTSIINDIRRIV